MQSMMLPYESTTKGNYLQYMVPFQLYSYSLLICLFINQPIRLKFIESLMSDGLFALLFISTLDKLFGGMKMNE